MSACWVQRKIRTGKGRLSISGPLVKDAEELPQGVGVEARCDAENPAAAKDDFER
jgi:hypothetical protein